jgi:hypothetical protein
MPLIFSQPCPIYVGLFYLDSPIDYCYILAIAIPGDRAEKHVNL